MLSREDIAWAGGLFEGEGCFTANRAQVSAALSMTDRDSVERFATAVGLGAINGPYQNKGNRKPYWRWSTQSFEGFQAVVAMLWPFLGERRKQRATDLLEHGRTQRIQHAKKNSCPKCGEPYSHIEVDGKGRSHRRCRPCQTARMLT